MKSNMNIKGEKSMCGRFTIGNDLEKVARYLEENFLIHQQNIDTILPRYNVAPTQKVIAIVHDGKENRAGLLQWGIPITPKNTKTPFNMINIRCESLVDKPFFISLLQKKRCIIIADSFYEWKKVSNQKIPMRIMLEDRSFFPMAGLWQSFNIEENPKEYGCAIITVPANHMMSSIHDRMPAILTKESASVWLDVNNQHNESLVSLLDPFPSELMISYQVSSYVNNPKNDSEKCIIPVNT